MYLYTRYLDSMCLQACLYTVYRLGLEPINYSMISMLYEFYGLD